MPAVSSPTRRSPRLPKLPQYQAAYTGEDRVTRTVLCNTFAEAAEYRGAIYKRNGLKPDGSPDWMRV